MDTLEKLRLELRETLSKASAKAAEWEGKEKEMPPEVLSEIDANIREAEAIKGKIDVLKRKAELDAYANEGVGSNIDKQMFFINSFSASGSVVTLFLDITLLCIEV